MPENWQNQNNVVSSSSNASTADNLEGAMWRLKIPVSDNQEGADGNSSPYPDRPGEPNCIYYLRTGLCGYGSNCRFNHPANIGQFLHPGFSNLSRVIGNGLVDTLQATQQRGELPERIGQPDCQYFLKTGTCKFGATCKYHHPRDRHGAGQVPLNILGLPMRQEEKSCAYYMRTGSCKFGVACKFNHPQPTTLSTMLPVAASTYGPTGSSTMAPSNLPYVGGLPAWSLPRAPYGSGPRVQAPPAYMPIVLSSQGMMPAQQGWSTYTTSVSPISSTDALGSNLTYTAKHPSDPGSSGQLQLLSASFQQYPERPDQPECQYYMKTGSCKYGPSCKYHHPKEKNASLTVGTLGPLGLPLRPGHATCTSYSMYGICKYGSACKFDHPLAAGYYNYALPALSIPDPSPVTYQRNSQATRSSSETSPSKGSKASDKPSKAEAIAKQQNTDAEAPEEQTQQSLSPSHTAPNSSESPHDDHSD